MIPQALRFPLSTEGGRDALAIGVAHVLVALVFVRVGRLLWPSVVGAGLFVLTVLPAVSFAGYLAAVLAASLDDGDPPPFRISRSLLRTGVVVLVVTVVYLLIPALVLLGTVALILGGASGLLLGLAPTVALLVAVAFGYVLPAGVATAQRRGLRAAFSRSAVGGLGHGAYFFAWTAALVSVVFGWGVLGAAAPRTFVALLAAVVFPYAHVVAAWLVGEGLQRSGF